MEENVLNLTNKEKLKKCKAEMAALPKNHPPLYVYGFQTRIRKLESAINFEEVYLPQLVELYDVVKIGQNRYKIHNFGREANYCSSNCKLEALENTASYRNVQLNSHAALLKYVNKSLTSVKQTEKYYTKKSAAFHKKYGDKLIKKMETSTSKAIEALKKAKEIRGVVNPENDKKVATIFTTKKYDLFKNLTGNRVIDKMNLKRICDSVKSRYLFTVILVNKAFEIIDGQHRFEAAKSNGLPIYFIIVEDYGINEVQILNSNGQNWNKMDYLKSYCELGREDYLIFRKFMEDFPQFGIQGSLALFTFKLDDRVNRNRVGMFQLGELKVVDIEKTYQFARQLIEFEQFYKGYSRHYFILAMIKLWLHKPAFKHEEMIKKLSIQQGKLVHCTTTFNYITLIEEIYNFKRKQEDKINLRY